MSKPATRPTQLDPPAPRAELPQNRLADALSPYLQQHAHNPVDWLPWGEEAFEQARRQDKPIFLSVGYATCHWCHVMAHESFEDPDVAARLNEVFVPVKVDREEHPEVDDQYMTVCQALTGSGGWPLTVLLTPERKPFFAGTYFPKESRPGRIGLRELIDRVEHLWYRERSNVERSAWRLTDALRQIATAEAPGAELPADTLAAAVRALAERFDRRHGGFGGAPKFPSPHQLVFLVRQTNRTGAPEPLDMARATLLAIRRGGVFDQLGLGVHRYSTDAEWRLPHFEKMLYDQALLSLAALEAFEASGDPALRGMAEDLLTFMIRELRDPAGGFHTAQDADSEGAEGRYYLWSEAELRQALPAQSVELFLRAYGVVPEGNFLEEATRERTGANVLYRAVDDEVLAAEAGLSLAEVAQRLAAARERLLERRAARPRPQQDDKILADQNGLALAALARGARVLSRAKGVPPPPEGAALLETATALERFGAEHLQDEQGALLHRFWHGNSGLPGLLDDYAFWIWGLIELYEATLEPAYLAEALRLQALQDEQFWDQKAGGYFLAPEGRHDLLVRRASVQDGAVPSGNSASALNLARLGRLTGRPALLEQAEAVLSRFAEQVRAFPSAHTHALTALDFLVGPVAEVVVSGLRGAPDTEALLQVIRETYLPRAVVLLRDTADPGSVDALAEYTTRLEPLDGRATAYLCKDQTCERPLTDPEELRERLLCGSLASSQSR